MPDACLPLSPRSAREAARSALSENRRASPNAWVREVPPWERHAGCSADNPHRTALPRQGSPGNPSPRSRAPHQDDRPLASMHPLIGHPAPVGQGKTRKTCCLQTLHAMRKRHHSVGPLGGSGLALPPQAGVAQSGNDPPLLRAGTPQPMQRLHLGRCRLVRPAMMRPSPCMAEAERQVVHAYGFGDAIPSSDWPWRAPHGRDPADGHRTVIIALGRPGPDGIHVNRSGRLHPIAASRPIVRAATALTQRAVSGPARPGRIPRDAPAQDPKRPWMRMPLDLGS